MFSFRISSSPSPQDCSQFYFQSVLMSLMSLNQVENLELGFVEFYEVVMDLFLKFFQIRLDDIPSLYYINSTTSFVLLANLLSVHCLFHLWRYWRASVPREIPEGHHFYWLVSGHRALYYSCLAVSILPIPYPPNSLPFKYEKPKVLQWSQWKLRQTPAFSTSIVISSAVTLYILPGLSFLTDALRESPLVILHISCQVPLYMCLSFVTPSLHIWTRSLHLSRPHVSASTGCAFLSYSSVWGADLSLQTLQVSSLSFLIS